MEPASLAFGVFAAFKDIYLTAKFIQKTAHTIKHFRSEQSGLITHFNVQTIRLKNFSRLFRGEDGNVVDTRLLQTVSNEYLQIVDDVFGELQQVLSAYTKLAANLDDDYKKHSPLSPYFHYDSQTTLQIDDVEVDEDKDDQSAKDNGSTIERKGGAWSFFGLRRGDSKTGKGSVKSLISIKNLPPGVQWWFSKDKLEETVKKFKEWNDELKDLVPLLLNGFGFYTNKNLQTRLQPDEGINIFQGHVELNKLAHDPGVGSENANGFKDKPIPWTDAELKMAEPRILVEYKQSGITLNQAQSNIGSSPASSAVRELYAPQLARLLRTAGKHDFGTLPFNAYAWDPKNVQYAFLFDYPSNAGSTPPQSLHDFILSNEPQYKLELKQRFYVAQTVARSIGAFHSDGWLHKSIRSHAIKFFFHVGGKTCDFSNPYLTDFEFSRPEAGVSRLLPIAMDIDHDVYRHPDRYGLPMAGFSKIHDVYSLGVVLLEIGLWTTARRMYDDIVKYDMKDKPPADGVPAKTIKKAFLEDARTRLAHRMGSAYQEAVVACLDGELDEFVGGREWANEFQKRVVQKVDIKSFVG